MDLHHRPWTAVFDLHSTLVRFYGLNPRRKNMLRKIYIPHWLDSMEGYLEALHRPDAFTFHTG